LVALSPKALVAREEMAMRVAAEADVAAQQTAKAAIERARLASGKFDGRCPVTCEACPVADEVKESLVSSGKLVAAAEETERTARIAARTARAALADLSGQVRGARDLKAKLDALKVRAESLRRRRDETRVEGAICADDLQSLQEGAREGWRELTKAEENVARALAVIDDVRGYLARAEATRREVESLESDVTLHRLAAHVLGRSGAQRVIAETGLRQIERLGRDVLADAGLDLSMTVQWAREGRDLASHCAACGTPFGRSRKVRSCGSCGDPRGPNLIDDLRVVPSSSSGAADDLVGIAFKLAAATWRRLHGAGLSVAYLDEPLAFVDESNKRAFAGHLVHMLSSRFGFVQTFVTAHDRAILDALPCRIVIEADDQGSRIA
jgi:DNA repair exonuclease SbcCD ATPase subunit